MLNILQLDLMALKKMRAQFEVQPLDCNATHVYPAEAIKCSATAIDMLNVLHGEAEDARNARKSMFCRYCLASYLTDSVSLALKGCISARRALLAMLWRRREREVLCGADHRPLDPEHS